MTIYQHFRKDEHPFVDQALEWQALVKDQYSYKLTDFLDPREQDILETVIGNDPDVLLSFWGGSHASERKRAILYPHYFEPTEEDYGLVLFKIDYASKFLSIEHPQVLGALMSIGLKRSKFGDILIKDDLIQIIVANEVSEFVRLNLESIGKAKVYLIREDFDQIVMPVEEWEEKTITTSSLRLDAILSEICHLSRQKIVTYIKSGVVKVNWKTIDVPSYECNAGDYLSVRGLGRSKLLSVDGKTKKDKWRITIGIQE